MPIEFWRNPVTMKEIEGVILNANINKAPRVDVFNAGFYKACWGIFKSDVIEAIMDVFFFLKVQLLKQVNITSITLVPKNSKSDNFCRL